MKNIKDIYIAGKDLKGGDLVYEEKGIIYPVKKMTIKKHKLTQNICFQKEQNGLKDQSDGK